MHRSIANIRLHLILFAKKYVFWNLPAKYRYSFLYFAYERFPLLFKGGAHFEQWRDSRTTPSCFDHLPEYVEIENLPAAKF